MNAWYHLLAASMIPQKPTYAQHISPSPALTVHTRSHNLHSQKPKGWPFTGEIARLELSVCVYTSTPVKVTCSLITRLRLCFTCLHWTLYSLTLYSYTLLADDTLSTTILFIIYRLSFTPRTYSGSSWPASHLL